MNTFPPFVIFSAERSNLTATANRDRTALLAGALTHSGIDWQRVEGSYNGTQETAFLVFTYEGTETADRIEELARRYGQESILYVDAQRYAYLFMLKEQRTVEVGKWQEIPATEAHYHKAWTHLEDKYYAAIN